MNPIAEEVCAAALRLREDLPLPFQVSMDLAELLEHIGDDMDDERAYEAPAGSKPEAKTVVFTDHGMLRSDWTAALATARTIMRAAP